MNILNSILDAIYNLLMAPVVMMGLLVCIGYILGKKPPVKVITGTISTMVGIQMVIFGGNQFSNTFKPITTAVSEAFGITGYIMDPYAMRSTTTEALGDLFGLVGYVYLIAFLVNIVLVYFGKYTKAKGVLLTGNSGVAHSQAILWLVVAYLGLGSTASMIIAGILVGLYWAYSTTLAVNVCDKVTDGGGFTIGHNQQIGLWFFSKFAGKFGDPKKSDAENLNLPGWLSIFNNNVASVAILMTLFMGLYMAPLGISGIEEIGGENWILYLITLGIEFSMDMVILLTGVRMMCGELVGAFKGIQEKIVPNAVPAIDVAALLPFSPNAATLGFVFTTLGTVLAIGILYLVGSPIMVLPGFIPLFFTGGAVGVVANKYGGIKSIIICCIILAFIQTFGTVWAISLMKYPSGVGWSGMFDWATVIPGVTEILKFIGNLIH